MAEFVFLHSVTETAGCGSHAEALDEMHRPTDFRERVGEVHGRAAFRLDGYFVDVRPSLTKHFQIFRDPEHAVAAHDQFDMRQSVLAVACGGDIGGLTVGTGVHGEHHAPVIGDTGLRVDAALPQFRIDVRRDVGGHPLAQDLGAVRGFGHAVDVGRDTPIRHRPVTHGGVRLTNAVEIVQLAFIRSRPLEIPIGRVMSLGPFVRRLLASFDRRVP